MWINDLERGQKDTFYFPELTDLDDIKEIEIWREGIFDDNWFVDCVTVINGDKKQYFPIHRWIPDDKHFYFAGKHI